MLFDGWKGGRMEEWKNGRMEGGTSLMHLVLDVLLVMRINMVKKTVKNAIISGVGSIVPS